MEYQKDLLKINRNLDLLAPKVKLKVLEALVECQKQGYDIDVFEGYRSLERQAELFSQGRSKPGKIITKSLPGQSFHNYGLAVDIAYKIKGKWSWEGDFDKPGSIFISMGFDPPPSFEKVHFQISNGWKLEDVKKLAKDRGNLSLWLAMGLA